LAEEKIPVLTEVYQPKTSKKSTSTSSTALDVTDDLVAKVTAKVKPRLEAEVTDFVLDELKGEMNKAQSNVIASTQDFVDKTKADLKTQLPQMYQESVKLAQGDMDALKKFAMEEASNAIRAEVADFQKSIVIEHQAQMKEMLESVAKRAEESTSEQIGIMHSRVGTIQQEAFAKLRADFAAEKDAIFNAATTEMKALATKQVTEGQTLLKENIEAALNKAIPGMESRLRAKLAADLQQLLTQVQFVLPK